MHTHYARAARLKLSGLQSCNLPMERPQSCKPCELDASEQDAKSMLLRRQGQKRKRIKRSGDLSTKEDEGDSVTKVHVT